MIESIDHVNLVVRDLPRMTGFYRDALGFQVTKQVTISGGWIDATVGLTGVLADVVYLDLPSGPRIELIAYHAPQGSECSNKNEPNAFGFRHIAFRVSGINELAERLRQIGVCFQSEVNSVPENQVTYSGGVKKQLVYFRDPEGNILELCEYK